MTFCRIKHSVFCPLALLFSSFQVYALPNTIWQGDQSKSYYATRVNFGLDVESVGKSVDYEPNLSSGLYGAAEKRPRYQALALNVSWPLTSQLSLYGQIKDSEFYSKRDFFSLQSYYLALRGVIDTGVFDRRYMWSLEAGGNYSPELDKNSYSRLNDTVLTAASIHNPFDVQLQASLAATFNNSSNTTSSFFLGLGHAFTGLSGVSGIGRDSDNCRYSFSASENAAQLHQLEPCGDVLEFDQVYSSYNTFEKKFGVNPDKDFRSHAYFWQAGASHTVKTGSLRTSLGYYYQHYYRGSYDDRIEQFGGVAITANHSAALRFVYDYSNSIKWKAELTYHEQQFLNQIPVFYNRVTSGKFESDIVYFSLSFEYSILK